MRTTIISLLLLIGTQSAVAATVTARASATVLEPVKITFQSETRNDYASIGDSTSLDVESARDLQYELSRKAGDVCLFKGQQAHASEAKMALASCETYTVNFN